MMVFPLQQNGLIFYEHTLNHNALCTIYAIIPLGINCESGDGSRTLTFHQYSKASLECPVKSMNITA